MYSPVHEYLTAGLEMLEANPPSVRDWEPLRSVLASLVVAVNDDRGDPGTNAAVHDELEMHKLVDLVLEGVSKPYGSTTPHQSVYLCYCLFPSFWSVDAPGIM